MLEFIIDFLFPRRCVHCRKTLPKEIHGGALCDICFGTLDLHTTFFCGECRARMPDEERICHKDYPYLLAAAADYAIPAMRDCIQALKFSYITGAAEPLGELIAEYLEMIPIELSKFTLVPIPLSARRYRQRGFNQAEEIARVLLKYKSMPFDAGLLVRARNTKPQSDLAHKEARMQNLASAFSVPHPEQVAGKNFIILDDVSTSGATLSEAARALKRAGARRIVGLVAAKA